jgi:hypothetical protein
VTSVEECTNEEIGVGADIAAGNHGENGKRADFVINLKMSTNVTVKVLLNV